MTTSVFATTRGALLRFMLSVLLVVGQVPFARTALAEQEEAAPAPDATSQEIQVEVEVEDNEETTALYATAQEIQAQAEGSEEATDIDGVIAHMTLDEKISQMIIVAARTWDGANVTDLSAYPQLADALRKHQYGGVILFSQNIASADQTARLVADLQNNNMRMDGVSKHVPYFMAVDEEGGLVVRFATGTRMTGSMAIGATGANAQNNALLTGTVLGEECAALGFNLDFAPDVDVNSNPANPVIGTRSFSDDPDLVGRLGVAFAQGLAQSNVIATYKHFPGHGDTGTDTHIGTSSVKKTYDQLNACELVPFRAVVAGGADMIMTAHVTLPDYDDQQALADGSTGYYPATMSEKVITELLRGDLGYDGVVVTDALEMGAVYGGGLVKGDKGSVEYCSNVAEKVINAGCDILLIPTDLKSADAAAFYDGYIDAIASKVRSGDIPVSRIDQSVKRILTLKQKRGIFDPAATETAAFEPRADAASIVGSSEHHATERAIADEAITLLKNDGHTLPLSGHGSKLVVLGRLEDDAMTVEYALKELQGSGALDADAHIRNLAKGTTSGDAGSKTQVTIDYYLGYDAGGHAIAHYTDELTAAIADADAVVCLTANYGTSALATDSPLYQSVKRALGEAHAAGGRFVLLSNNLPYDAGRYTDADAILLGYMAAGLTVDPTDTSAGTVAYNPNVVSAFAVMFDEAQPTGTLPVSLPSLTEADDGTVSYNTADTPLYARGYGLEYAYAFLEGAGATHTKGSGADLAFKCNARHDKLSKVLVDGKEVASKDYRVSAGSTHIALAGSYLDTLSVGEHRLVASYDYGSAGTTDVETGFKVVATETTTGTTAGKTAEKTVTKTTATSSNQTATPNTGDGSLAWGVFATVALLLFAGGILRRRGWEGPTRPGRSWPV